MIKNNDIRQGRHCLFVLQANLVFLSRRRQGVFTPAILEQLQPIFASVCQDFGAELLAFQGGQGHVELRVSYPAKVSVSQLVNSLKGVSSRMIRKMDDADLQSKLWQGTLWSPSYFAGSCDADSAQQMQQYIEQQ